MSETKYRLGIDIGSTTVKVALIDDNLKVLFSDYQRHYANIQETLASLLHDAIKTCGNVDAGVWHLLITLNLNNPLFKPTKAYFFVKFFQILCGYMCLYMI